MLKKLFLIIFLLFFSCSAQINNTNLWMMRGDATVLPFTYKKDLTGDTLIFAVKESKSLTAVRILSKESYNNEIAITAGATSFFYISLLAGDTDDFTLAKYYYDISRIHDGDTTTIFIGELNLQPDIGTPFDGTDITGRVTTVSLTNGTVQDETILWDTTGEYWRPSGLTGTSQLAAKLDKTAFDDTLKAQASRLGTNDEVRTDDYLLTYDTQNAELNKTAMADLPLPTSVTSILSNYYTKAESDIISGQLTDERMTEDARLQGIIDSLGVEIQALKDGILPVITPLPVTNFVVSATSSSAITGTFTEPVDTGTYYIQYRIYSAMGDQLSYENIDTVQHGNTTFSVTGLLSNTTYQFRSYTIVSEVPSSSIYSNEDTATTFSQPAPSGTTYDYYVSSLATGGGDGSDADEFTLFEAVSLAQAGDTVLVKRDGIYNVTNATGKLNFANDGTAASPIVFIGQKTAGFDYRTVDEDSITFINSTNYTYDSQAGVNVTGDYVKWQNLCVRQSYNGKMLLYINAARRFEMDSCVIQYPSNVSSSSVHTVRIVGDADSVYFKHSQFWHGSRTIIWVQGGATASNTPDYFMLDGCTMSGATNHYAIQLMPETTLNPSSTTPINGAILKDNLFIDNNYNDGAVHLRHCKNFKIYNNVMLNSGGLLNMECPVPASGDRDTCNTEGSVIAYNTVIDTTNTSYYMFRNVSGGNQLIVKNNLVLFSRSRLDTYAMDFRCNSPAPASILRHQIDYNSWAFTDYSVDAEIVMWDCGATSRYLNGTWTSVLGYDAHGFFNEVTEFEDIANGDFRPVLGSLVIDAGTPLTSLGITTDRAGNPRSATQPTIGAYER